MYKRERERARKSRKRGAGAQCTNSIVVYPKWKEKNCFKINGNVEKKYM